MSDTVSRGRKDWLFWIFAALGVAGVISMIVIAVSISGIGSRNQPTPAPLAVQNGNQNIAYRIGNITDIRGSEQSSMEIVSGSTHLRLGSGSLSRRDTAIHNIILVDQKTGKSRRLLANNNGQIISGIWLADQSGAIPEEFGQDISKFRRARETEIGEAAEDPGSPEHAAMLERVRNAPLNYYMMIVASKTADKIQSELLVGRLSDGEQAMILDGIESIERYWLLSPTTVAMIVQQNGEIFHHIVNFATLSVNHSNKIEI